jgi:hypothetical protein
MTPKEFYETLKEYAKKEMQEESNAAQITNGFEHMTHVGAANEAEKFFRLIVTLDFYPK